MSHLQELNVEMQLQESVNASAQPAAPIALQRPQRAVLIYWLASGVLGVIFLRDWLLSWQLPATFANPWLLTYLIATFALGQYLYILVARGDGRPISWPATAIFALGNGLFETLAFALVYRLGAVLGSGLVGLVAPAAAPVAELVGGLICFTIYGGLIHGLFWLRLLPPHLDDSPRSRSIRRFRPLAEVALVIGWSLCLWLNGDIWTIVLLHVCVDIGLMLRVRPPLFRLSPAS